MSLLSASRRYDRLPHVHSIFISESPEAGLNITVFPSDKVLNDKKKESVFDSKLVRSRGILRM